MKGKPKDPNTRNITVTNPKIIEMLRQLRKKLSDELGVELTNTQALTLILKKALEP